MKPTLWYYLSTWFCACVDFNIEPPEGTEDYIRWLAVGHGVTPQEAYDDWQRECKIVEQELRGVEQ